VAERPGWFKVYRGGWLWSLKGDYLKVALMLLSEANWEASKVMAGGELVTIPRGSCIIALRGFAERCDISVKVLRGALTCLERQQFLAREGAHHFTKITILNYEKWQGTESGEGTPEGTRRAHEGHDQKKNKKIRTSYGAENETGQASLFGAADADLKHAPKRPRRQPADEFLDAFARGAGSTFLRPPALDKRTAPMLNKLWKQLREPPTSYTLADIEAAGRQVAGWRELPVDLGWLTFGTNLVDAIARARAGGKGGSGTRSVSLPPPLERRR
jgi:hypothetical protein